MQQFKIEIGEVSPEEGSVPASAAASWRQSSSFSSSNTNFVVETPKSQPETASAAVTQQAPKLHQSGSLDGIQMNGTAQTHTAQGQPLWLCDISSELFCSQPIQVLGNPSTHRTWQQESVKRQTSLMITQRL